MNFEDYVRNNYNNCDIPSIPKGFASAQKMNTVDGDRRNSIISPQRSGFYSEATILIGANVTAFGLIDLIADHDPSSGLVPLGSVACMGLANVVRKRAKKAMQSLSENQ